MNHAAPLGPCLLPGMHINVNPSPLPCCRGLESHQCSAGMNSREEHVCCTHWWRGRDSLCVPVRAEPRLHQAAAAPPEVFPGLIHPSICNSGFWGHPYSLPPPISTITHLGLDEWSQCDGKVCFPCLSFPACRMAQYHPLELSYMSWLTHSVNCFEIFGWWGDKGKLLQFVLLIR